MKFTPTELSMLISLCGATVAVVLHALQRSKCHKIACCGHLVECERDIPDIQVTNHRQNEEAATENAETVQRMTLP